MNAVGQVEFAAVICAAGASSRMGGLKKEYCPLPGANAVVETNSTVDINGVEGRKTPLTVLGAAVSVFAAVSVIGVIIIAVPPDDEGEAKKALPPELLERENMLFVSGGKNRRASVHNALLRLVPYSPRYVLIHDGCRPWVDASLIERTIDAVKKYRAVVPLLPLTETPKEIECPIVFRDDGAFDVEPLFVTRHLSRARVGAAQTPQAFSFPEMLAAHESALKEECAANTEFTDDAEVWGAFCGQVAVVPGSSGNRKITFPGDLG